MSGIGAVVILFAAAGYAGAKASAEIFESYSKRYNRHNAEANLEHIMDGFDKEGFEFNDRLKVTVEEFVVKGEEGLMFERSKVPFETMLTAKANERCKSEYRRDDVHVVTDDVITTRYEYAHVPTWGILTDGKETVLLGIRRFHCESSGRSE